MEPVMGNWIEMKSWDQRDKMAQPSLLLPRTSVNPVISKQNCPTKSRGKGAQPVPDARSAGSPVSPPGASSNRKTYIGWCKPEGHPFNTQVRKVWGATSLLLLHSLELLLGGPSATEGAGPLTLPMAPSPTCPIPAVSSGGSVLPCGSALCPTHSCPGASSPGVSGIGLASTFHRLEPL